MTSISRLQDGIEGGQWAGWTLNLDKTSTSNNTVTMRVSDSLHEADFGRDYTGVFHIYNGSTRIGSVNLNSSNGWKSNFTVPAGVKALKVYAQPKDDATYEGKESIKFQAIASGQSNWVTSSASYITDEADMPQWQIGNTSVSEGGYLVWNVSVHTATKGDSWTEVNFANGSGQIGTDTSNAGYFQASYDGGRTWGASKYYGDMLIVPAGSKSFKVRLATTEDSTYEGNETVTIKVTERGSSTGVVKTTTTATGTITNDDAAPKVASIEQYRDGVEGGTSPGWTLKLNNPSQTATTVRLNFHDSYHEADHGADYSGRVYVYNLSGQKIGEVVLSASNNYQANITVPAGQTGVRLYAQTLNDNVYEGDETIKIRAAVSGRQGWVTSEAADITDDADKPTLSVADTHSNSRVYENDWAYFKLKLSKQVDQDVDVKVSVYTGSGSYVSNQDLGNYQYWNGSKWAEFESGRPLTFAAKQTEIQLRVKPINDNIADGNETLLVRAQPASGETHIGGGQVSDTVTVIDRGYRDMSNAKGGHVHWHADGSNKEWVTGNGWRSGEKVELIGPDGRTYTVWADNNGNFTKSGYDLFTRDGTLTAKGKYTGHVDTISIAPSLTPIVLDLDGNGIDTSSVMTDSVNFDFDGDGVNTKTGWISGNDGLLVRDINDDGKINDGSELFGSDTRLEDGSRASDGYQALAQHDTNADGIINKDDEIFDELQIWVDKDHDGVTDEGELLSLDEAGVASLNLNAEEGDEYSSTNRLGMVSDYTTTDGETRDMADVWFANEVQPTMPWSKTI